LVLKFVGGYIVANHQALEIFCALIHKTTKHLKGWKHSCVILVDTSTIPQDILTKNEDKVNVRAQVGCDTQRILHRDHCRQIYVTTVHEYIASRLFLNPGCIVQTVVENQECPRVNVGGSASGIFVLIALLFDIHLSLNDIHHNVRTVFVVNEFGRNHMLEKFVGNFSARDDSSHRKTVLCVEQNITNQKGLASVLFSDNDNHWTLARVNVTPFLNHVDVEFPQLEVHVIVSPRNDCS